MSLEDGVDEIEELEFDALGVTEAQSERPGRARPRRRARLSYQWQPLFERAEDDLLQRTTLGCFVSYNSGDRFRYFRCMLHAGCEKRFRFNTITRLLEESGEHGADEADLGLLSGGAWRGVGEALGEEECIAMTAGHRPQRLPSYLRGCLEVLRCGLHDRCGHLLRVTLDSETGLRTLHELGTHSSETPTAKMSRPRKRRARGGPGESEAAVPGPRTVSWALLRRGMSGVACEAATAGYIWEVIPFRYLRYLTAQGGRPLLPDQAMRRPRLVRAAGPSGARPPLPALLALRLGRTHRRPRSGEEPFRRAARRDIVSATLKLE